MTNGIGGRTKRLRERLHLPGVTQPETVVVRLKIRPAENGAIALRAQSPAGERQAISALPDRSELLFATGEDEDENWRNACRAGERLFTAVFPTEIDSFFRETVQEQREPCSLVLDLDPSLERLPWEVLRDPEHDRFLALSERLRLSRAGGGARSIVRERGNLRVNVPADHLEESDIAFSDAIGEHPRVDLTVNGHGPARPHLTIVRDASRIPSGSTSAVFIHHGLPPGDASVPVVALPDTMPEEARQTFAVAFTAGLADGQAIDEAVQAARRAVAAQHGVMTLAWAAPSVRAAAPNARLVTPARPVALETGTRVAAQTIGWFRDALTGSISAVAFLIAGLLVYRYGFSTSNEIELDILSPFELFSTFKSLILALSTRQDRFLLILTAIAAILTLAVGWLWLKRPADDLTEPPGFLQRLAGRLTGVEALSFLGMATATLLGAFLYQQYLWQIVLPIPKNALGLAVTREAAAASIRGELEDTLYAQGQSQRIVIRDLPVAFDAGDTGEARKLGKRIGAQAVLIYRETSSSANDKEYSAYVVFTDPGSASIGANNDVSGDQLIQVREGVEIPALRTDSVSELVAAAAGMIAYNDYRYRESTALFEQAMPRAPDAPNVGLVSFYLGESYRFTGRSEDAIKTYEGGIAFYEAKIAAGETLSAADELLLVKSYIQRGWISATDDSYEAGRQWIERALPHKDSLLARADKLDRPLEARLTFAKISTYLAAIGRRLNDPAYEKRWEDQAYAELQAIDTDTSPDDFLTIKQSSDVRFLLGDCTGSLVTIRRAQLLQPESFDVVNSIAVNYMFQGRTDLAIQTWQEYANAYPDNLVALEQLALAEYNRAWVIDEYLEPSYVLSSENMFRELSKRYPENAAIHDWIADYAEIRAGYTQFDGTAQAKGDELTLWKSQMLWSKDDRRLDEAIDAVSVAVEERRILATELSPGDKDAVVSLASTYALRQFYTYEKAFRLLDVPEVDRDVLNGIVERVYADGEEVRRWANFILAPDSDTTRLQRLLAWGDYLTSLSNDWIAAQIAGDTNRAASILEERRRMLSQALPYAEAEPIADNDEIEGLRAIYSEASLLATADGDTDGYNRYRQRVEDISEQEIAASTETTTTSATICREARSANSGDEKYRAGDFSGAKSAYDAGLAVNPEHLPSLIGLAKSLIALGDPAAAIEPARHATEVAPSNSRAWSLLTIATGEAGDPAGSEAALETFLETSRSLPNQHRMAELGVLLEMMERASGKGTTLPVQTMSDRLVSELDAMPEELKLTYQYPLLYTELARLALDLSNPAHAVELIAKSLAIDPVQPEGTAIAAIAAIVTGADAGDQTTAALGVLQNPIWLDATSRVNPFDQVKAVMTGTIDRAVAHYPDKAAALRQLRSLIESQPPPTI
jgi:tetratricopeptide (TPR) repeat protein